MKLGNTKFRRMTVAAVMTIWVAVAGYSQNWADAAQAEKDIETEFKKQIADLIILYDGKFTALKSEKIKGFESEKEFKVRIEKATKDLTAEREKAMNPLEKAFQDRLRQTALVTFTNDKVAIDLKAIDPETKTFPITLTAGIAPVSFPVNVSYSIKNSPDIRTAYYRFVDLHKAKKLSAEVQCIVDTADIVKSHFLHLKSWRIYETETGFEFASATLGKGPAIAWCATLPPKALEISGRVTIRSSGKDVAEVWIDSVKKGVTPLALKGLTEGELEYTIKWSGISSPNSDDSVMITLGPNPEIVVTAESRQAPESNSRSLSNQEQSRLRTQLANTFQTSDTKVGAFNIYSVERYSGFVVVSGMVTLNVMDPRGGIAVRTQSSFKLSL